MWYRTEADSLICVEGEEERAEDTALRGSGVVTMVDEHN